MNINESQNRQDKQYTDKGKENCDLSSALSEESNSQKSAGKYILIISTLCPVTFNTQFYRSSDSFFVILVSVYQ